MQIIDPREAGAVPASVKAAVPRDFSFSGAPFPTISSVAPGITRPFAPKSDAGRLYVPVPPVSRGRANGISGGRPLAGQRHPSKNASRLVVRSGGVVNWTAGYKAGEETHTLTYSEYPNHNHTVNVFSGSVNSSVAEGAFGGFSPSLFGSAPGAAADTVNSAFLGSYAGGGTSHDNMQPYLVLLPGICFDGIYPNFP